MKNIKWLLVVLLCLCGSVRVCSQSSPPNLPYYDDKVLHYGFVLGYNQLSTQMIEKENRPYIDTVLGFHSSRNIGLVIGFTGDLRLCQYVRLRFQPSLNFADRRLNYSLFQNDKYSEQVVPFEVVYLELPLEFKLQAKRWRNFRPYIIAGGKYSYDLASIKRKKAAENEILMKVDNSELFYTLGAGFDFYLNYFKFGIELKTSYGLSDILVHDYNSMYSDVLDKLKTQIFYISLTFE